MSITFELVSFELGGVLPFGWQPFVGKYGVGTIGHEFSMVGTFKIKSGWEMKRGKRVSNLPALEWREKEFWYQGNLEGTEWTYKGETDKGDLYQSNPKSPTWGGFNQSGSTDPRRHGWVDNPGQDVNSKLHDKLLTPLQRLMVNTGKSDLIQLKATQPYKDAFALHNTSGNYNKGQLKMWWMAAEHLGHRTRYRNLPCIAVDRPGIALSGGSGASGGGFVSKASGVTRRRILQFDLGIVGNGQRFTATQVLESINGKPSISKFIIPGKDDNWCRNVPDRWLAYWRSRLNSMNVEDQTTEYEGESTIIAWEKWVEQLEKKGLV